MVIKKNHVIKATIEEKYVIGQLLNCEFEVSDEEFETFKKMTHEQQREYLFKKRKDDPDQAIELIDSEIDYDDLLNLSIGDSYFDENGVEIPCNDGGV